MSTTTSRGCNSSSIVGLIVLLLVSGAWAAPPKKGTGTTPPMKIYPCAGQLTRAADLIITMEAGKAFYTATDNDAPVTTPPLLGSERPQPTSQRCRPTDARPRPGQIRERGIQYASTSAGCTNAD